MAEGLHILKAFSAENQQKKTSIQKKQKQAMFFSSLRFQLFVDLFVMAEGFEPSTACLEGRCSIQLSYATIYD